MSFLLTPTTESAVHPRCFPSWLSRSPEPDHGFSGRWVLETRRRDNEGSAEKSVQREPEECRRRKAEGGILPLQASAKQARSSSSDRSGDAETTCPPDSPRRLPAARDISVTSKRFWTGDQGPCAVRVFWLSLSVPSLVRLLWSSTTKATITARRQLLNLAHTWAGLCGLRA